MGMLTEQAVYGVIRAARPTFRNSHDKVAFAVHASFMASGFLLHATGSAAFAEDALHSSSLEEVGTENWNQYDGYYGFVYSKPEQGTKKIVLKALAMDKKLLVDALQEGDSEPGHLEINVDDYVLEKEENYQFFKNFGKLVGDIQKELVNKYDGSSASTSSDGKLQSRSEQVDNYNQNSAEPGVEIHDSRDLSSVRPPQGYVAPPVPGIGGDDLFPGPGIGMYPTSYVVPPVPGIGGDDLFPGPGIGMYPTRGGFGGSGGMLVGPHDPRFGLNHDFGISRGPPGSVPPGARFDPFGPPDVPGFEPGSFVRNPRRGGGGGGGVHPDLQHFRGGSDFI